MVTPIELTAAPTYSQQTVAAVLTSTVAEASPLSNRKGVTFHNMGPSNLYICGATGDQSSGHYITVLPYDSVVYVINAVVSSFAFYFAVPASGSAVVEREEWL